MVELSKKKRKSNRKVNLKTLLLILVSLLLGANPSFAAKSYARQVRNTNEYYHTVSRSDHRRVIVLPLRSRNPSVSIRATAASTMFLVRTTQPKIIKKVLTEKNGVLVYKNLSDQSEQQSRVGNRFSKEVKSPRRQVTILSSPFKRLQRANRKTLARKRHLKYVRPRLRVSRPRIDLKPLKKTQPHRMNVYKSRARVQVQPKARMFTNKHRSVTRTRNSSSLRVRRLNRVSTEKRMRPLASSTFSRSVVSSSQTNQTWSLSHQRSARVQSKARNFLPDQRLTRIRPDNFPVQSNFHRRKAMTIVRKATRTETLSDAAREANATTSLSQSPNQTNALTEISGPKNFAVSSLNSSTEWWKGNNVCNKERAGVFGRNRKILNRLLQTKRHCVERRNQFICVETYNIGGQLPVLSTAYFCCPGFAVSVDRERCDKSAHYQETENFQEDSSIVNRIGLPYSPITRAAPDGKILTIFMPSDEVIEDAFLVDSGPQGLIEPAAVQSFFENHLILNRKITSSQMRNNQVLTAFSGNPIRINFFPSNTSDVMTANCRKVSLVDEVNDNSIVHYIDGVLSRVSGNIYDYLVENENEFSSLIEALRVAGLLGRLRSRTRSFTLFAPTNDAFDAAALSGDSNDCLRATIGNLLVEDVICTAAANENNRTILTLESNPVTLHQIGDVIFVNDAIVIKRDVMTTNGVIHKIDRVLKTSAVSSMLEILSNQNHFSTMVNLFQIAGIKNALATGTNFTLIVPTNKAFKKTSRSELLRLTTYVEDLRSVLMFHLIPKKVKWEQLKKARRLETLNPPNDVHVNYYPMKAVVRSGGKKRYVQKAATTLQCARILGQPRSLPCNGELYFIDKVLTPPTGSLLTALTYSKNTNFSMFLKAIKRSGLDHLFEGTRTLTLFAPSNRIFARIPNYVTKRLLQNKKLLIKLIKFHLIPGYHCAHEFLQKPSRRKTLLRSSFTTCPKRGRIYLGRRRKKLRAKVTESNIEATNGVIHAIDNILLPRKFKII